MLIPACAAKIHRATVTQADLNYIGSISIDENLLIAAGIHEGQYLNITNCSNAVLWRTYAMAAAADSGIICLNGPPARLFAPGDKIIILAEVLITPQEIAKHQVRIVFVDDKNKMTERKLHPEVYHPHR